MRLVDSAGSLDLRILGYEFPQLLPSGPEDWDANWLVVSGRVDTDGRSWSFRDPCLTTWEAAELLAFLNRRTFVPGDLIEFVEPNLALVIVHVTERVLDMELTFRAEAAPPELTHDERWGDGTSLVVTMDWATVHSAAAAWAENLAEFPVR